MHFFKNNGNYRDLLKIILKLKNDNQIDIYFEKFKKKPKFHKL